jgi:phosphatidylserine/phosphatidylglycerophosphate/cardiolipin synthase-like enzyme
MLFLSGCSLRLPKLFPEPVPISDLPVEALFIDRDAIYNRTLTLIQSAQTSIYVEQAEFDDPRLIQLLLTKSRTGIDVRILLDQWQKVNRATLDQLKSQNVSIQYYPAQKGQINHTKYLIVDQNVAMIYGPSWTVDGLLAHDLAVELSGKSAWKAATLFSKDWEFTTTFPLTVPKTSPLPDDKIVLATNANVKQQLAEQISASTKSIWIEISEITDPDLIQALIDAAEKGRDVRLILDRAVTSKTPVTIEKLTAKNIPIRYFPSQTPLGMHLAIFDNSSFLLSSSEWTRYSFVANHEFSITVPSPLASTKLGDLFKQDWEKSTE